MTSEMLDPLEYMTSEMLDPLEIHDQRDVGSFGNT